MHMTTPIGPNLKKLIILKVSRDAIPKGGNFIDGVRFLQTPGAMADGWKAATAWAQEAIRVVRLAAEPNPWKDADDETIAKEVLRQVEAKKGQRA